MSSKEQQTKQTEYRVIRADSHHELVERINKHLAEGYIPQGGVCVIGESGSANHEYYQAIYYPGSFSDPRFIGHL